MFNQQTTSSKVLTMTHQQGLSSKRASKKTRILLSNKSRGISFRQSSNNTPSSPPSGAVSKIQVVPEEKFNEELPAVIGDVSYFYPLVVIDNFKWAT